MALRKERCLPSISEYITQKVVVPERGQDKNSQVQPKVNRLRRTKRSGTSHQIGTLSTNEGTRPKAHYETAVIKEICEDGTRSGTLHTFTKTTNESRKEETSNSTSSKFEMSSSAGSLQNVKLKEMMKTTDSKPDIIDLCGDEEQEICDPLRTDMTNFPRTRNNECGFQALIPSIPQTANLKASDHSSYTSAATSESHKETRSGLRERFSDEYCELLLDQIQTRNPHFPVRHYFCQLLKRRSEFDKECSRNGSVKHTGLGSPRVPASGKRKQDSEGHSDDGGPPKRCRLSQEVKRDSFFSCPSWVGSASLNLGPSDVGLVSRSRLSVSRRRKQQPDAPLIPAPVLTPMGGDEDGRLEEDVLWTEKYQPRHSGEVIGNSSSVKQLQSWLKEWRMRADVEERRRRQEEQRMQEKSSGLWDCGDFEGELVMREGTGELCNTVLIQGPTGVGKTAAVYACAEELGFKVFEVNSSALRSGRLVLSQLKEATQSHQVGAPRSQTPKPARSDEQSSCPHKPAAVWRKEAPKKVPSSCRKNSTNPRRVVRKRAAAPPPLTLTHFFKKTIRTMKKSTEQVSDPQGCCSLLNEASSTACEVTSDAGGGQTVFSAGSEVDRQNSRAPISLILFEEVDVIFDEDVGFLTAVKTLMSTSKRPVILTTSDPRFRRTLKGRFVEIHFRTPSVKCVGSFLQCVCAVESVRTDPGHIDLLVCEMRGDVRRSVLELELWSRSGAGGTPYSLQKSTVSCNSWADLERRGYMEVLIESWRKGQSLLYSNLHLILTSPATNSDLNTFETVWTTFQKPEPEPSTASLSSDLKEPRMRTLGKKQESKSSSTLGSHCLASWWSFFDTMSFLDSYLSRRLEEVRGHTKAGALGWTGARLSDSLVDEPSEEEEEEEKVSSHTLERSYEMLAVVEGLAFHRCRMEVCEMRRRAQELMKRGERETPLVKELTSTAGHDVSISLSKSWESSDVQKNSEIISTLSNKTFRYHSNKRAVVTDYLPSMRTMSRVDTRNQKSTPR